MRKRASSPVTELSCARRAALTVLAEAAQRDAYVRELLSSHPAVQRLDRRDAAFATRLALGATATSGCLDDALNAHLDRPKKVALRVRLALRIAAFELLYLGTSPEVAVSQGVELVRSVARGAAGLANAVLRRVAEGRDAFFSADDVGPMYRAIVSLARKAGLPAWLMRDIESSQSARVFEDLSSLAIDPAPIALHLNAYATSDVGVASASERFPEAEQLFPGCLAGVSGPQLMASGALDRAEAVVSDVCAQLIATAAARPGTCLEIGAGRGTKTYMMMCQAKRLGFEHRHVALDLFEGKCALNLERLGRAGITGVQTIAGDACHLDGVLAELDEAGERTLFGTVFVDAPCSGTGTMRRHPEIPWRLEPREARTELPALQLRMLTEAASRVASGGELYYATCSILRSENRAVVESFLQSEIGSRFELAPVYASDSLRCPGFSSASELVRACEPRSGLFQSLPAPDGYDGHFCARFKRLS